MSLCRRLGNEGSKKASASVQDHVAEMQTRKQQKNVKSNTNKYSTQEDVAVFNITKKPGTISYTKTEMAPDQTSASARVANGSYLRTQTSYNPDHIVMTSSTNNQLGVSYYSKPMLERAGSTRRKETGARNTSESEWRAIGVQQSHGWVHYAIHRPSHISRCSAGQSTTSSSRIRLQLQRHR